MKGVILSILPQATVIDITHDVPPFEILNAAFTIAQSYAYFPKGSVHVVVIDPGVGSSRRALLTEAGGQFFISPDNGVMTMVYQKETHRVRSITNRKFFRSEVSRTFHGRDVFAPCAAHLAAGSKPAAFGKRITDYIRLAVISPTQTGRRIWMGSVLKVDRFGNLITNFHVEQFPDVATRPFELSIGLRQLYGLAPTFSECDPGQPCILLGSSGYLEVVINQASAATELGCGVGTPAELTFHG